MPNEKRERRLAAHRRWYARTKAEKRCVACRKQDELTLNGQTRCEECRIKKKKHGGGKPNPEARRARTLRLRAANLCVDCCAPLVQRSCPRCKKIRADRYAKRKDEQKCVRCGRKDEETLKGRVLCQRHNYREYILRERIKHGSKS